MKLILLALISSSMLTLTAQAQGQRVLVVMKSEQTFKAADYAYKTRGQFALKGFNLGLPSSANTLTNVDAQVEDSLSNLNTLVLNVNSESEINKLRNNPDVALVEAEFMHPAPRPFKGFTLTPFKKGKKGPKPADVVFSPSDKTPWGILSVKAPAAWNLSKQGQGARVLVLDTGIDKEHPSLKANFEKGEDFVGDNQSPYPYADGEGHGTHVSGTIAGMIDNTGFSGVAPKAKILMGRVCSSNGCSNISIARGINWGITEKVDVISMSLGGNRSTPAERTAVAKADQAGVTVVAASGNDGTGKVSYPAALPTVIAVGAVDVKLAKAPFSQWGPELSIVAPGVAVVSSVPQGTGREADVKVSIDGNIKSVKATNFQGSRETLTAESNTLVNCGLGKPEDFAAVNVQGKYALISRGEISFGDKVKNAIAAGATGAVIYNNAPGLILGSLTQDGSTLSAAAFMIEQSVGLDLVNALASGLDASASLHVSATDYAPFDGTSMATPHVAGVVALMKATNKNLLPSQVKSILKSTALALGPNTNNEFGSGFVNAEAAVSASVQP